MPLDPRVPAGLFLRPAAEWRGSMGQTRSGTLQPRRATVTASSRVSASRGFQNMSLERGGQNRPPIESTNWPVA